MPVVALPKIRTFKDIVAWQECRNLYGAVYGATKSFPKDEIFGMTSQMRRAASSAASNIAEGYGRATTADKLHFYVMSRGSLTELSSHIQLMSDVGLLTGESATQLEAQCERAHKLVVGLIKATRLRS